MIAASPGIRGSMVVSLAIMEDPPGFKPTNPAHSNLMWGSCGSSSIATEFTLSGSILAFLEQRIANLPLTLQAPITTAADNKFCNIFPYFRKKIRCDIS